MNLQPQSFARTAFTVAWSFFIVTALLGVLLRLQLIYPLPGFNYSYFLHAHSHIGFLGWVFNAFFALALALFIERRDLAPFLFWFIVLQAANIGMLIAYPLQGYAAYSIAFTSLHMLGSIAFAWLLWRRNCATPVARAYLNWALVWMILSGAGPLALGPLGALDLRSSVWYDLAIYTYLHFQYNGWFVFFLLAASIEKWHRHRPNACARPMRRALPFWITGTALTLALSTLWLEPPWWVYLLAAFGGATLVVGCAYLLHYVRDNGIYAASRSKRGLRWLFGWVLGAFLLKNLMQLIGSWPGLTDLANHHYVVIGFLHWMFLAVVTPFLIGQAVLHGWLQWNRATRTGIGLIFAGTLLSQAILFLVPAFAIPWPRMPENLLAAAVALLFGAFIMGLQGRR